MDAILPVYKPVGITSFDVIRAFKRAIRPNYKIGHAGTLDPFADGVLILLLGKATKQMNVLTAFPKTYQARVVLGATSDTLDVTGAIIKSGYIKMPSVEAINNAANSFVGCYEQEIPQYSAAKVNGKPRYLLARKGEVTARKTKLVEVYSLQITSVSESRVEFITKVSAGTYIRQLSYDIFNKLGIDSYLAKLTRMKIGYFSIANCARVSDFDNESWKDKLQPPQQIYQDW